MANKQHIRLNNLRNCKRFLSTLINEVRRGERKPEDARIQGYLAKILIDTCVGYEFDKRIEALEKADKNRNRGGTDEEKD